MQHRDAESFQGRLEHFLRQMIIFSLIISLPVLLYSIYMAMVHAKYSVALVNSLSYAVLIILLLKAIPFTLRAALFSILFYLLGTILLFTLGQKGAGMFYLFSFPLFAAMLLPPWTVAVSIMLVFFSLFGESIVLHRDPSYPLFEKELWSVLGLNLIGLLSILSVSISLLFQGLQRTYDRKQQALRLAAESEERLKVIVENAFDATVFLSKDGSMSYYNKRAEGFLEDSEGNIPTKLDDILPRIHPDERETLQYYFRQFVEEERTRDTFLFRYQRSSGEYSYIELTAVHVQDRSGLNTIITSIRDLSELKRAEEKMFFYRDRDPGTGLYNEHGFRSSLVQILERSKARGVQSAVICLGSDTVHKNRHRLDEAQWNFLIKASARRFKNLFREEDSIARLGTTRFLVALYNINNIRDIIGIYTKAAKAFERPFLINNCEIYLHWMAGIALYPQDFKNPGDLVKKSEACLDYLLESSSGSYLFYNRDIFSNLLEQIELEEGIIRGMREEEFYLCYQAKVDEEGSIRGLEALARWRRSDGQEVSPELFIAAAERGKLIGEMGKMIIEMVIVQLRRWKEEGLYLLPVAINIPPSQLGDLSFIPWLSELLECYQIDPGLIEFEITERDIIQEEELLIASKAELKQLGITFSLDDFGTGYSSMIRLKEYPLTSLKIDKAFIRDLPENEESEGIVRSILMLAEHLGFTVVAEGIEEEKQLRFLIRHGCQLFQGYYLHRPEDAEQLAGRMKRR